MQAHSDLICSHCFNLLDRIDTLEVELRQCKDEVMNMYRNTMGVYEVKPQRRRRVVARRSALIYPRVSIFSSKMNLYLIIVY